MASSCTTTGGYCSSATPGGPSLSADEKATYVSELLERAKSDPTQPEAFRLLGHHYKEEPGGTQRAIRCYQKAVMLDPLDEETGETLCNMLENEGQEVLEAAVCREAFQRSRRAFWACRRLGYLEASNKKWADAIGNLQHAIRGYPTCRDLWEALGLAYQQLGMLTASLKAYGRAIALDNCSSVFSMQQSGIILLTLGSYKKAISMFQSAIEYSPLHLVTIYGLASALLGHARECIGIGAFGWGTSLLKEASELVSSSIVYYNSVASLWKLFGDVEVTYARNLPCQQIDDVKEKIGVLDYGVLIDSWTQQRLFAAEKARRAYQQALHLQPCQGNLYGDLSMSLGLISYLKKQKRCVSVWSVIETTVCCGLNLEGTNSDLWTVLGVMASHKALRQHALIQALRLDGNHAIAWAQLGNLYLEEGHEELAKEAFDHARTVDQTVGLTWAGMSLMHSRSNAHFQEAFDSCLYAVHLAPRAEFQLGLARIAASLQQLGSAQIYAAVEQAVLQAPHRPEAHNFKGLICELRGKFLTAITAFQFARDALNLSSLSKLSVSEYSLEICINLARAYCKAGKAEKAVAEYQLLEKSGRLENDTSILRGYAMALWQLGKRELAMTMVKKALQVAETPGGVACTLKLVFKFTYFFSGSACAASKIYKTPKNLLFNVDLALTFFAIASASGIDDVLLYLVSNTCLLFNHERAPEFVSLMIKARQVNWFLLSVYLHLGRSSRFVAVELFLSTRIYQISGRIAGKLDGGNAYLLLQQALHMYPHSVSLRRNFVQVLLERNNGYDADLASRCCIVNSKLLDSVDRASACEMTACLAMACHKCGSIKSQFTFSSCGCGGNMSYSTLLELQRWFHTEPSNVRAHYYMILCLLQKARETRFPSYMSKTLQRMTTSALDKLSGANTDGEQWGYMHLQLMLCASESALHVSKFNLAIEKAKAALTLQLPSDCQFIAHLQLARCHAAAEQYDFLEDDIKKCHQLVTRHPISWFSLFDLEIHHALQCGISFAGDRSWNEGFMEGGRVWRSLFQIKLAEYFLQNQDFLSAEKSAAEASSYLSYAPAFHLFHGALCMELLKQNAGSQFLSLAIQSLSKAQLSCCNKQIILPVVNLLLAQAEASQPDGISKWEKHLQAEWCTWKSEIRPAELYFQMGLLSKRSKATIGNSSGRDSDQSTRIWIMRAIHLNPACFRYWMILLQVRNDGT